MKTGTNAGKQIDWYSTTWEGNRVRQLETWAKLTFDEILDAQEQMAQFARDIAEAPVVRPPRGATRKRKR